MKETLLALFEPLKQVHPAIYTLVIAFTPLIELRGSIPIAIAMGLPWLEAFLWSLLGSILPAFFVIPLFATGLKYLKQKHYLPKLTAWLDHKFADKAAKVGGQQEAIEASNRSEWRKKLLKFWSIVVFVAIPLPGTGVWTGSAIASMIEMPFKSAFLAVLLGDIIAGVIVTAVSMSVKLGLGAI